MATTPRTNPDPLEARLETSFYDGVRRLGGLCEKIAPTRAGIPDRVVLLPGGRIFFVELKTLDGAVRAVQRVWHQKAKDRGTEVVILRGAREVLQWLEDRAAELG